MLMWCGHAPDAIDDYNWADVELFLEALPTIWANTNMIQPDR